MLTVSHIWTHWAVTSGSPCWESTINSSWSLRLRMSWKSPCRPSGEELPQEPINQSSSEFPPALDCLPVHRISSNLIQFQFCILISWPTNRLLLALFSATNRLPVETALLTLRNGARFAWHSVIVSFLDIFQQNLVVKCILHCLKNSCVKFRAKISTNVSTNVHPVYLVAFDQLTSCITCVCVCVG